MESGYTRWGVAIPMGTARSAVSAPSPYTPMQDYVYIATNGGDMPEWSRDTWWTRHGP